MPTSLVIGALVIAWLVILVPMVARRRQEVAKTADSVLAARVVRSGTARSRREEWAMPDTTEKFDHDTGDMTVELPLPPETYRGHPRGEEAEMEVVHADDLPPAARRYRPGRGGFDPETAELDKQAKYARRQRTVLAMLVAAVATALFAAVAWSAMWWLHGLVDLSLVCYLTYLRRQVRIEEDVLYRRMSRARGAPAAGRQTREAAEVDVEAAPEPVEDAPQPARARTPAPRLTVDHIPGTAVVDIDDGDPEFDELEGLDSLPYRRAVGQ